MSTLFLTLIIAFLLVVLAIAALSVGWLLTGRSKIVRGACGMDPSKLRKNECGTDIKCGLCEKPSEADGAHAAKGKEDTDTDLKNDK